jgi:hypothetical protein
MKCAFCKTKLKTGDTVCHSCGAYLIGAGKAAYLLLIFAVGTFIFASVGVAEGWEYWWAWGLASVILFTMGLGNKEWYKPK